MFRDMEEAPLIPKAFEKNGRLTVYLIFVCFVSIIGGFGYGYQVGVVNNSKQIITNCSEANNPDIYKLSLEPCFPMSDTLWGTIVSMFAIGGLVGGLISGWLADKFGRTTLITFNNFFFIFGSLLMGFSINSSMLLGGRMIAGIASGVSTVVIPMYIGEIAPTKYRGALGVLTQLSITLGILISQFLGLYLSTVPEWRWLMSLTFFTSLFQTALLPFCVQSPRWLIMKSRDKEAKKSLERLRGITGAEIDEEFDAILQGQKSVGESQIAVKDLFLSPHLRKPLMIGVILQIIQQLSGVNAVFYYSTIIFSRSADADLAQILTVIVGLWNVLLTVLSVYLMDKLGRRVLLILGEVTMIVIGILYTIAFSLDIDGLAIFCTYSYVAGFAVGLGPIPFLILAEIFPTNAVGSAMSVVLPFNWAGNFLVAQLFPLMTEGLGDYAFLPFAGFLAGALVFTLVFVPETKGKSLEDITIQWRR